MKHQAVSTKEAPAAIGPYSQAVKMGDFVFCSGQVGLDPASGALVGGDVAQQTEQALRNLGKVLEAAGSSLSQVVKTTVFLTTMDHFTAMNEVYARHFSEPQPARATVAVAGLPRGGLVEVEAIAYKG